MRVSRVDEHMVLHQAYPGQKIWAVSALAFNPNGSGSFSHAALVIPADDQQQADSIGWTFITSRFPAKNGWHHSVTSTSFNLIPQT